MLGLVIQALPGGVCPRSQVAIRWRKGWVTLLVGAAVGTGWTLVGLSIPYADGHGPWTDAAGVAAMLFVAYSRLGSIVLSAFLLQSEVHNAPSPKFIGSGEYQSGRDND